MICESSFAWEKKHQLKIDFSIFMHSFFGSILIILAVIYKVLLIFMNIPSAFHFAFYLSAIPKWKSDAEISFQTFQTIKNSFLANRKNALESEVIFKQWTLLLFTLFLSRFCKDLLQMIILLACQNCLFCVYCVYCTFLYCEKTERVTIEFFSTTTYLFLSL